MKFLNLRWTLKKTTLQVESNLRINVAFKINIINVFLGS